MTATHHEPAAGAVSFLVVADQGEPGWGVEVMQVEAVLPPDEAGDAFDAARFGFPGAADNPPRVIRLRSARQHGGVAVRSHLTVVTVARDDIHALPSLLAMAMPRCAFASVVFSADRAPFLILDVDAVLGGQP